MNFDHYRTLRFDRRGRVLTVTLNLPDKLNSLSGEMHTEMSRVFIDVVEDPDSDLVVLTGAGRAFSAGGDIEYMQWLRDNPPEFYRTVREAKRLVGSMLECDKPIIAKLNGDAIGLGMTVALFCDVCIAADHARFADPHNNVGLLTGDGGQIIWPLLMGYARAKHYLFTGERMTAKQALDFGLIYAAVPAGELDAYVDAYLDRLSRQPAQSLRWSKAAINTPLRQLAATMMDIGMAYENVASATQDHQEAIHAFRDRRPPAFKGR